MSFQSNVKENLRLLDLSSDEESEDLQLEIIPNRKKKISRKERNRNIAQKTPEPNVATEVQCALCWAMRGTLLLWLLMLTWICASLYDQVSTMKIDVNKVSTSSNSVGDALQICHTAAKELRANATELSARLSQLELDHQDLVKRVEQTARDLALVSGQLSAAPNLADTPRRLADLQRMVADFGSQIKGFDSALASAKKQAVTAESGVEEIKTLLHQLETRTNETIANLTATVKEEGQLKEQLVNLNTTLVERVGGLQEKIIEMNKSTSTTTSTTTTTIPPPVQTQASNVSAAPGPAKPAVTQ
ncbi:uncharacterized protein LOC121736986 isoform X2 [Aricia agestis]|uniref:uncharacterized protein LOC121736986 isoform X2 n=1 Tax=Aricia agestis TaxID=91739 RepID=UPI001C20B95A|nr:uncharacterized protein LOC121736986 isoform X2 [Aricia agestis]